MRGIEVIRRIQAAGWRHTLTTGSHWHFSHAIGTLKSVEKQSGVKLS